MAIKAAVAEARAGMGKAVGQLRSDFAVIREAAPSLTTGLLVATFLVGAGVGAIADRFWTRSVVNQEWRDRIAAAKKPTLDAIEQGNADAADVDAEAIENVKGAFSNAAKAEKDLQDLQSKFSSARRELDLLKSQKAREAEAAQRGRCSVPVDCLRRE